MKNKKILIGSVLIIAVVALSLIMISSSESAGSDVTSNENTENMPTIDMLKNSDRTLNVDRIMSDGTYQIRFSDLVSLEALQTFKDKTVTAIGYLSPIASYDGSFGYLMNLPYQTCPYCLPSDTKITNTIASICKTNPTRYDQTSNFSNPWNHITDSITNVTSAIPNASNWKYVSSVKR